jgi:ABC-type Fe3+-hydroxamate transport system substrate-binding protein
MRKLFALFPIIILALAACGSTSSGANSTTGGATGTTTTNCLTVTSGTIQRVSNGSLLLTNLQGKNVQVALTSATVYTRQSTLTSSEIKTGTPVSVIVTLNPDNTYTALSVSLRNSQFQRGGFTSGTKLCSNQGQFPGRSGTPRTFGTPGSSNGGRLSQTITGTVSQANGSKLIVTDTSGTTLSVNLTATTRITAQVTASISDLHSGIIVSVTGLGNRGGVITANSVAIVQGFPNRRLIATPTTSA